MLNQKIGSMGNFMDALAHVESLLTGVFTAAIANIDGSSHIIANHGHQALKKVITELAQRFLFALQEEHENNSFTTSMYYIGNDEFAVIIEGQGEQALAILEKIRTEANQFPIRTEGHSIHAHISVGFVEHPLYGKNTDDVFRLAHIALQEAKKRHNAIMQYRNGAREINRTFSSGDLFDALNVTANDAPVQLVPYFQPILKLPSGKLAALEVLLRAVKGNIVVSPSTVFEIARIGNRFLEVDQHIIRKACATALPFLKEWGFALSLNISPEYLDVEGSAETIIDVICFTGFPINRVRFEVLERNLTITSKVHANITKLSEHSEGVYIDDFGAKHSIGTALGIPLGGIKLDKELLGHASREGTLGESFISTLLDMIPRLNLPLVVEGVEKQEQHELLSEIAQRQLTKGYVGFQAQGFFYAKPMPPDKLEAYLLRHHLP